MKLTDANPKPEPHKTTLEEPPTIKYLGYTDAGLYRYTDGTTNYDIDPDDHILITSALSHAMEKDKDLGTREKRRNLRELFKKRTMGKNLTDRQLPSIDDAIADIL